MGTLGGGELWAVGMSAGDSRSFTWEHAEVGSLQNLGKELGQGMADKE